MTELRNELENSESTDQVEMTKAEELRKQIEEGKIELERMQKEHKALKEELMEIRSAERLPEFKEKYENKYFYSEQDTTWFFIEEVTSERNGTVIMIQENPKEGLAFAIVIINNIPSPEHLGVEIDRDPFTERFNNYVKYLDRYRTSPEPETAGRVIT